MPNAWAPPTFNNPFPGLANAATAAFGGGTADPALTAFPASTTANKSMHTKMKLFLKTFEDFLAGAPSVLNSGEVKKIKQAIWKAARRSQIATFNPYAGPWKEKVRDFWEEDDLSVLDDDIFKTTKNSLNTATPIGQP